MTIQKTVTDDQIILKVEGWLDTQTAPELKQAIEEMASEDKKLVLDFEKLEYISSAGIRQIVYGYKKMNGHFLLKNVHESIINILSAIGLSKKIPIR